jgi:hypothetical protein
MGFPIVTDPDSGPPTLSVAQYKAGKGDLRDMYSTDHLRSNQYKPKNWT